jgi:hypothetical protein
MQILTSYSMAIQGLLGGIASVILVGAIFIYAGVQTDTSISGILIIIGILVWIGGAIGIFKNMS